MSSVLSVLLARLRFLTGGTVPVSMAAAPQVVDPNDSKPKYTLEDLLEGSDYSGPRSAEEQEWLDSPAVGRELL